MSDLSALAERVERFIGKQCLMCWGSGRVPAYRAPEACPSCGGLNISCPDGCERDPASGELNDAPEAGRDAGAGLISDVLGGARALLREYLSIDPSNRKLYAEVQVANGRFADIHSFYEAMIDAAPEEG